VKFHSNAVRHFANKEKAVDPKAGMTSIVKEFSTIKEREKGLPDVVKETKQNKFNSFFIERVTPKDKDVSQLFQSRQVSPSKKHKTLQMEII